MITRNQQIKNKIIKKINKEQRERYNNRQQIIFKEIKLKNINIKNSKFLLLESIDENNNLSLSNELIRKGANPNNIYVAENDDNTFDNMKKINHNKINLYNKNLIDVLKILEKKKIKIDILYADYYATFEGNKLNTWSPKTDFNYLIENKLFNNNCWVIFTCNSRDNRKKKQNKKKKY